MDQRKQRVCPLHNRAETPVLLNGVGHEEKVFALWDQGVPRRDCHEAQKHEGSHERHSVGSVLFEAHDNVAVLEFLFSVLQQSNKAFFGTVGEDAIGHLHEEFVVDQ